MGNLLMQSNARHIGSISLRRDEMPRGKNTFEDPVQHIAWQYGILKDVREIPLAFERGYPNHLVLGIPEGYPGIPKTRQPYLEGLPISLGIWVWGYRKHGDTQITVTALFFSIHAFPTISEPGTG